MLIARNISKRFGGVIALDHVNLELHPGKVNAITGENGAGKSTLMKIFSGVYSEYDGEINYKGQPVKFKSTSRGSGHRYYSPGTQSCSAFINCREYFSWAGAD